VRKEEGKKVVMGCFIDFCALSFGLDSAGRIWSASRVREDIARRGGLSKDFCNGGLDLEGCSQRKERRQGSAGWSGADEKRLSEMSVDLEVLV
jgi:hypothetical protein